MTASFLRAFAPTEMDSMTDNHAAIKLDAGQKHFLSLIVKGADADGWAPVSAPVFPLVEKMPGALVELESIGEEGRGRARLTERGQSILDAMAWL